MKIVDILYLSLYGVLKFFVWCLPYKLLMALARGIALLAYALNYKHRKIIKANLRFCFPQKDESEIKTIALKIYKNFARFAFDMLKNKNASKEDIKNLVSIENKEFLQAAFETKRTLVFTTAHYGCWELIPLVYASHFGAISVVTRTLDSKVMNALLVQNRTKNFDVELIDKIGAAKKMLLAIKNKRTLGILTDQDASDNESMVLEFFGKKVNWNVGASVIAKKSDALLIPAFIYQKDGKYAVRCFEAMDATKHSKEELTLYQAKSCEEMIKFKPDEYFFFHKRFKRFYNEIYE